MRAARLFMTTLFAGTCLMLAAIAAAPWLVDPLDYLAPGAAPVAPAAQSQSPGRPSLEAPAMDSLAVIIERPLFTATRRAAPALEPLPTATAVKQEDKSLILGRYKLTGIIVTPSLRLVFITEPGSRKTTSVALGEKLDGWLVAEVEQHVIVLESDGRRKTIHVGEDATIEISSE